MTDNKRLITTQDVTRVQIAATLLQGTKADHYNVEGKLVLAREVMQMVDALFVVAMETRP